ncbi:site-2 protease family protein [Bacillus marinisedimentorum]|uniref:site-2 protease family protein n=1 Tax=Bacillus marinisedimentorum TaxID=1821260 RepID=UPI0008722D54|nr:site-2 protease family protein [Bacillus marinisedimentorum]
MDFFFFDLEDLPYLLITLAIAFSVHEFSHAYVAYKFGDPTAKDQGRLTLSPFAHLDLFGTIMILIAGFGWARPVPVNRFYFKKPRLSGILVSAAGPLSNLFLAAMGFVLWYSMIVTGLEETLSAAVSDILYQFLNTFIYLNVILFVFNLLPFPPLDGYRIVEDLSPPDIRAKLTQYESFGIIIFLFLIITPLYRYTIQPIFNRVIPAVTGFLDGMFSAVFF